MLSPTCEALHQKSINSQTRFCDVIVGVNVVVIVIVVVVVARIVGARHLNRWIVLSIILAAGQNFFPSYDKKEKSLKGLFVFFKSCFYGVAITTKKESSSQFRCQLSTKPLIGEQSLEMVPRRFSECHISLRAKLLKKGANGGHGPTGATGCPGSPGLRWKPTPGLCCRLSWG